MATPDITIYGAGIFGLSIGFEILKRGFKVKIVDISKPGFGASGGLLGALAPHTPDNWNEKKEFQLSSLLMQQKFWTEVYAISGVDVQYSKNGRIIPLIDDRAVKLSLGRTESAKKLWKGFASWETISKIDTNWYVASPTGLYSYDTMSAQLNPRKACKSLELAVKKLGATIEGNVNNSVDKNGLQIWATGHQGLNTLSKEFNKLIGDGVKGQAALLTLDRRTHPQLFTDGIHIIPQQNNLVAIGSTSETIWTHEQPDSQLDQIIQKAKQVCPALINSEIKERWSGIRPRVKGRSPLLGPHPSKENIFIANGGFKIGIGLAPKVAEVTANFILNQQDMIPKRFTPAHVLSLI